MASQSGAPENHPDSSELQPQPTSLFKMSTITYGIMVVLGLTIMHFAYDNVANALTLPATHEGLRLLLIGGLGAGLLLVLSYFFEDWFPSFRELKAIMMRLLGPSSIPMALYLAAVSAIGEEIFFRGAIQPFAGLFLTSVLFGILHMGPGGRLSAWTLWSMIAGLLIGWMYEETGNLWPSITAHFAVNAFAILNLRRLNRLYQEMMTAAQKESDTTP